MYHRKRRESTGGVELNLAAMLDMAFQLLAFFILTFRPVPVEGQLALHLPKPNFVVGIPGGPPVKAPVDPQGLEPIDIRTLTISVYSEPNGEVKKVAVGFGTSFTGPANSANLFKLQKQLSDTFEIARSPYEQIQIRVASGLKYQELMKVMDVCTKQKMSNGKRVENISFIEMDAIAAK